jgi:hypothetical protein
VKVFEGEEEVPFADLDIPLVSIKKEKKSVSFIEKISFNDEETTGETAMGTINTAVLYSKSGKYNDKLKNRFIMDAILIKCTDPLNIKLPAGYEMADS